MKRMAVLVDAGYFWAQTGVLVGARYASRGAVQVDYAALHAQVLKEVRAQLPDGDLLRVYWYDGPGRSGKTADHHAIDQLDDFKLRLGWRSGAGQDRGVDGLMVADLMGLAQQRAISHALVVSGNADITPGVLAAQGMGVRVHWLSLGNPGTAAAALAAEADLKRYWGEAEVQAFASPAAVVTGGPGGVEAAGAALLWSPPAEAWAGSAALAEDAPVPSLAAVAQLAQDRIKEGPHAVVFAALKPGVRALPREIDSSLLSVGRQELGRALTEPEKRELRQAFHNLVSQAFDGRVRREHGYSVVGE